MLPYRTAYWTFEGISFAAFAVFLILFVPQCKELILFSSLCFPLLSNFLNGQDVTLLLLLAAGSILAIRNGHGFLGGLLLSLCAIKGHLLVLTPLVFLIHRRWMALAPALSCAARQSRAASQSLQHAGSSRIGLRHRRRGASSSVLAADDSRGGRRRMAGVENAGSGNGIRDEPGGRTAGRLSRLFAGRGAAVAAVRHRYGC
jgi:hypothetical protein